MQGLYRRSHRAFSEYVHLGVEEEGASLGEAHRMEKEHVQDIRGLIGRYGTGNGAYQVNKLISRKPVN